jgi:hypothetical protein
VVEGTTLEMWRMGNCTESSNLSLSANNKTRHQAGFIICGEESCWERDGRDSNMLRAFCEAKSATCTETVSFESVLAFSPSPQMRNRRKAVFSFLHVRFGFFRFYLFTDRLGDVFGGIDRHARAARS